jgi:branched-chain amino acid transport system ATP-binding protein
MFNIFQKIRDRGLAILLIEQNLRQAIQVADRAYMIENGELIDWRVPNILLSEQRLLQKYM